MGRLLVQRLPIPYAASQELRPVRNHREGIGFLRQQSPERRMMPAEGMPAAVAMFSNSLPQLFRLSDELFACHLLEVFVHSALPMIVTCDPAGAQSLTNQGMAMRMAPVARSAAVLETK
jgi:hypothetical protein